MYHYRLGQWSAAGELSAVFERQPSWFAVTPPEMGVAGGPNTPPYSFVRGSIEDGAGRVWTAINVAAPAWKEGWTNVPPGAREVSVGVIDQDKLYRSVVEVIDPQTQRVVARSDVPARIIGVLNGMRAVEYQVDSFGKPHILILRLAMTGPGHTN